VAGCCVLWVRKCGWILCAVGEGVWLDIVCCGGGSVIGCCVLRVRESGWMLCVVGEGVWTVCCVLWVRKCAMDVVCCG